MRTFRKLSALLALIFSLAAFAAPQQNAAPARRNIILATTTSTQDSGLLDVLIPVFEKQTGYLVKTISVGSGQALKMGERGEADVLLVHSPDAEKVIVAEGFAIDRRLVMHNDFVVVGPPADPAGIKGLHSAKDALQKIAAAQALFFSRGDDSGTNALEIKLWKASGLSVDGKSWYRQTGLGMGQTLIVAAEKKGYTLTDRGTYLALKPTLGLNILVENDPLLLNIYHVMEVNPARWPKVNYPGAVAFADFMLSRTAQEIIRSFGTDRYSEPFFFPDAGKPERTMF